MEWFLAAAKSSHHSKVFKMMGVLAMLEPVSIHLIWCSLMYSILPSVDPVSVKCISSKHPSTDLNNCGRFLISSFRMQHNAIVGRLYCVVVVGWLTVFPFTFYDFVTCDEVLVKVFSASRVFPRDEISQMPVFLLNVWFPSLNSWRRFKYPKTSGGLTKFVPITDIVVPSFKLISSIAAAFNDTFTMIPETLTAIVAV